MPGHKSTKFFGGDGKHELIAIPRHFFVSYGSGIGPEELDILGVVLFLQELSLFQPAATNFCQDFGLIYKCF